MTRNKAEYQLNSIYLYLTDRCNLKCRHCWIEPLHYEGRKESGDEFDLRFLKKAIGDAREIGLNRVKLTGGEPFLRKDILDIIAFLHDQEITIDIETNGTLMDKEICEVLRTNSVNQVSVSLDSMTEEQHETFRGVKGCYQDAVKGLSLLAESGISTQLIMTLYKENVSEIERLVDLSSRMGVGSIKINPVMPTGRGKKFFEKEENVEFSDLIKIDRWIEEELVSKYKIGIHFDIPIGLKSLKCIRTRQLYECNIVNIIGILSDGTISLCGIGQTETALNMGNIAVDDIRGVWASNPILHKLRTDIPHNLEGICGRCIFKFRCRGACRACAYGLTGSLNSPFFVCHEAYERGLFLESRMIN